MNLEIIRERYLQDTIQKRLGALAANLARILSFSKEPSNTKVVKSLLEESKYFVEWLVPELPIDLQEKLVQMQIHLAVYAYRLDRGRGELQGFLNRFRQWADELLKISKLST